MLEEAGISTVCVYIRAFRHHAYLLKPPRTLVTQHILGRTVGAPGDAERQRAVVRAALPWLSVLLVVLLLVTYFPAISLLLPDLLGWGGSGLGNGATP